MALVPYRVSGAAADQASETRLFQIGGSTITIHQRASGSLRQGAGSAGDPPSDGRCSSPSRGRRVHAEESLGHVGLVVWQSAFVLAELLLRQPPFGQWHDVRVVDLGTGTGVVGIALALAGADVVLTDLPHITPLTQQNVDANCRHTVHRAQVVDLEWGSDTSALGRRPDLVTGADVVYEERCFPALLASIEALSAAHTVILLAFRLRGRGEKAFEAMLSSAGFAVSRVPVRQLHEEYRSGDYVVLRACRYDAAQNSDDRPANSQTPNTQSAEHCDFT